MYKYLLKISRKLSKNNGLFNIDMKSQKKIFEVVKKKSEKQSDIDDIKRSYLQYLCQMKLNSSLYNLLINLISLLLTFPTILYLLLKSKYNYIDYSENIGINLGVKNTLPKSLKSEFKIINGKRNLYLKLEDIKFIFYNLVLKYPLSFHFIFKNILKISLYRYNINIFPNASSILVSSEYSFTSSFMTKYCNDMGLKHINYMHGEKMFYIRDSFVKFDRFYVWDEYYKNLFLDLNAFEKQFIVELPEIFIQKYVNNNFKNNELDRLTYYLQGFESDYELNCIKDCLDKFNNLETKVRAHPIYSDKKKINKYFNSNQVEMEKDILKSLSETKYIVSKYSTVLYQGYLMDKNIVIDDISSPTLYQLLKEFKYIIFKKQFIKLSDLLT